MVSPTLKAILGIVLLVAGIAMVIRGEDAPLEGEGLVTQFLPKRLVGLVALVLGVVFLASLASENAGHISDEVLRVNEKQHHLEDTLSAVVGIPFALILGGVGIGIVWESLTAGDIGPALFCAVWVVACGFGCLESTAYLGLTEDPLTMLRHL